MGGRATSQVWYWEWLVYYSVCLPEYTSRKSELTLAT